MRSMERTAPRARAAIPVSVVAATVVAGPDSGAHVDAEEELTVGTDDGNTLRLRDPLVARHQLELRGDARGVRARDLGAVPLVRVGATWLREGVVPSGTVLLLGATAIRVEDAGVRDVYAHAAIARIVGESAPLRLLVARVARAARSEAPVLVLGESGTGKELVARALHELGPRREGPFVVVDAGAIAETLVASELFGHERGAFTGAREARAGALEQARGGTLFLDEVGELPLSVQPMLLGALARGVARRVGGERELPIDVRVIAATHRDLRGAVNEGRFRADLYHRLAVLRITTPALRDRLDDVPLLVESFLAAGGWTGTREEIVPDAALARWAQHSWPGNVRELRNAVDAAVALREPPELGDAALGDAGPGDAGGGDAASTRAFADVLALPYRDARDQAMASFERHYLARLLEASRQNVAESARRAGLDRTHLHDLLKRHGLR